MNVAIFASAFYPSLGGVEELVRQLAHAQSRAGGRPLIITNRWPKTLPAVDEHDGLPVRRYVFRVPEHTLRQWGGALLFSKSTQREICRDLQTNDCDVIHVQCVSSNAYYALRAKRHLGLPLVVTLQGELTMDATKLFERSSFARSLMRAVLNEADAVTACSAKTLAEAEEFLGKPFGERGRVIYNGVDLSEFEAAVPRLHRRPYLLAIGRHVTQKGFDVLLRAWARAIAAGLTGHDLIIAGDGPERAKLEAFSAELKLSETVCFIGRVDRQDVRSLFAGCSVFVLPSMIEPMGIVNLEAMASGKAVVASAVGGVPEIVIDEKTGLLVPAGDPAALANGVMRLCRDRALSERFGAAGRARAQQIDWCSVASQYEAIYRDALSSHRDHATVLCN